LAYKFSTQVRYRIYGGNTCSMMMHAVLAWAVLFATLPTEALPRFEQIPGRKRQNLVPSPKVDGADEGQSTASHREPFVEEVERFAVKQVDAVSGGFRLLAETTQIVSSAMVEAVLGSASKLGTGDFQGAVQVASDAVDKAEEAASSAKAKSNSTSWTAAKLVLLVVFVASLWGLEHLLSSVQEPATAAASPEESQEQPKRLAALDSLRYLLSWMVVLYNYYPWTIEDVKGRDGDPIKGFASWGLLACPMFFVLSGFCHAYSKKVGPKADVEETLVGAMVGRIMPWYPMYVIVLIFLSLYYFSYNAEDWATFMAQLFLFNGAYLASREEAFPYLPEAWWFSFLTIYMLSFWPLYTVIRDSSLSVIWTVLTICCLAVFPLVLMEWIWSWESDSLFLLMEYAPSFLFGEALAMWQVQACMLLRLPKGSATKPVWTMVPTEELPATARVGATMSILIMGIMMTFCSIYDNVALLGQPCTSWLTKGLLLPVFGMLITGLANEVDPIAKVLARKPLCWAGRLSMSQVLLALPVHIFVSNWGLKGFSAAFVLCLIVASFVGHFCIEQPSRSLAAYICQARPMKT